MTIALSPTALLASICRRVIRLAEATVTWRRATGSTTDNSVDSRILRKLDPGRPCEVSAGGAGLSLISRAAAVNDRATSTVTPAPNVRTETVGETAHGDNVATAGRSDAHVRRKDCHPFRRHTRGSLAKNGRLQVSSPMAKYHHRSDQRSADCVRTQPLDISRQ